MYPSSKNKMKLHLETKGKLKIGRRKFVDGRDKSDQEESMGGYDPVVPILARPERRMILEMSAQMEVSMEAAMKTQRVTIL